MKEISIFLLYKSSKRIHVYLWNCSPNSELLYFFFFILPSIYCTLPGIIRKITVLPQGIDSEMDALISPDDVWDKIKFWLQ